MLASPWDRFPHANPLGYVPRHNRTAYRTEFIDAALSSSDEGALRDAGEELRRRRGHWRVEISRPLPANSVAVLLLRGIVPYHANWSARQLLLYVTILIALTLGGVLGVVSGVVLVVLVLIAAPLLFMFNIVRARRQALVADTLHVAVCPACGHDVSGVDAVSPERTAGERVGPRACPECGSPWPLIPPPAPASSSVSR